MKSDIFETKRTVRKREVSMSRLSERKGLI